MPEEQAELIFRKTIHSPRASNYYQRTRTMLSPDGRYIAKYGHLQDDTHYLLEIFRLNPPADPTTQPAEPTTQPAAGN
jgi:hypothetical protein